MQGPLDESGVRASPLQVLLEVQPVPLLFVLVVWLCGHSEFYNPETQVYDSVCHVELVDRAFVEGRIGCRIGRAVVTSSSSSERWRDSVSEGFLTVLNW